MSIDEYVSIEQLGYLCSISKSTIYKYISENLIPIPDCTINNIKFYENAKVPKMRKLIKQIKQTRMREKVTKISKTKQSNNSQS